MSISLCWWFWSICTQSNCIVYFTRRHQSFDCIPPPCTSTAVLLDAFTPSTKTPVAVLSKEVYLILTLVRGIPNPNGVRPEAIPSITNKRSQRASRVTDHAQEVVPHGTDVMLPFREPNLSVLRKSPACSFGTKPALTISSLSGANSASKTP